ncbi:MAG TPA: Wzz/FepE/Etk N-terminal domain-containing protein [Flavipsychrobacter sp.]|nr:Wzz/FepE/Etk N-terminal domain-containing protein [Flavipsychrobacter sp.]
MDTTPRFDLVEIVQTLAARRRFILIVTVCAAIFGALLYLLLPKEYEAKSSVFVANPIYTDRGNIFRNTNAAYLDYFGDEDDIDKVMAIATSEQSIKKLIANHHLAEIYEIDTTKIKNKKKLLNIVKDNLNLRRTEFQGMEFSYSYKDRNLATAIVNDAIQITGNMFQEFYTELNSNVVVELENQSRQADSSISALTDSLAILRNQFGIYDILSPTRQTIINGSIQKRGTGDFGKAIEQIQNIEAMKDQLVKDRAQNMSLLNEFKTGMAINKKGLLRVISPANAEEAKQKGLGGLLTVVAFALIGFFFSVIWSLLASYYKALSANR